MTKDNVAFLAGGIAFGFVFGYGLFHAVATRPSAQLQAAAGATIGSEMATPSPAGPMAPTQSGAASGGAPMLQEINALKRRVQANPQDVAALNRLANLYHDAGMYPQAASFYEKAVELRPADADLLTDYGSCLQATGDSERALLQFARAQKANPRHWQSLFNTAVVLGFNLHRYDAAEAAVRKVEEIVGPGSPDVTRLREALAGDQAKQPGSSPSNSGELPPS